MAAEEILIAYDSMKSQMDKEVNAFLSESPGMEEFPLPQISFEKGATQISFPVPPLTDSLLFDCLQVAKKHIDNLRITSFDDGHYAFQALNRNMFKTENMLDNLKIEFFSLISFL